MKVSVNIRSKDIARAMFYLHIRNKFVWGLCIFPGSLNQMVSFVGLWAMGFPIDQTITEIIHTVLWIFFLNMVGYVAVLVSLLLNPKWRKGRVGNHTLEIVNDGIIEETEYNRSEIKWKSISNIALGRDVLFIRHSGADIFVVPKSGYQGQEDWNVFCKKLKDAWSVST